MLKRFLKINDPVDKTLTELGYQKNISEENISTLKKLLNVLLLLKAAIKKLSKNLATLLNAELFINLYSKTKISYKQVENLSKQIKKKTACSDKIFIDVIIITTLMIFVGKGNIPHSTKYFDYTSEAPTNTFEENFFKRIHISGCDNDNTDHNEVEEV